MADYKNITADSLIKKFWQAIDEGWGYILGTAGIVWTQAKQDATTNDMAKKYGQKWVGKKVADCSGLFAWAFKQLGSYMYHGSNTMWNKYCVNKGELKNGKRVDKKELKPGTAVFTDHDGDKTHVGLLVENGFVIEASGTKDGVITSKITNSKWKCWGELKYVVFSDTVEPEPEATPSIYPTIREGAKGDLVMQLQDMLSKLGSTLKIDGIFGSGTRSAVRAFQNKNGLVVDGIVGPKTWGKLLELTAGMSTECKEDTDEALYYITIHNLNEKELNELLGKYADAEHGYDFVG